MEILQKRSGSITVLDLQGNIVGAAESSLLIDILHELLEQGQKQVVLDLTHVDWMNSSGLGTLISGLTTMRQSGGNLKLSGLSKKIKNLFSITKLLTVFEIFPTADEAAASFMHK